MGTKSSEAELFDSTVTPRDHKVAKYMLKSMGNDAWNRAKSVGKSVGGKIKNVGREIISVPSKYKNGYVDEKYMPITMCINGVGGMALGLGELVNAVLSMSDADVFLYAGKMVGYTVFGMCSPVVTISAKDYLQSKHREAIEAVYGASVKK